MLHKIKTKRPFAVALSTMFSLLLLLTAYQNCGESLTALNFDDSTSGSLCEGECFSVDDVGDETSSPSDGNEMIVEAPPGENGDTPLPPEDPPPGNGTKPPSTNQWIQVPKRTQAQKTAGIAGGEGWQQTPGMAFAPSNSNIAYLVSDTNGVWKTTNANADPYSVRWERKANGFFANGGLSIVVDPTNPDIVYVAGSEMTASSSVPISQQHDAEGIFRTTDGGDNWARVADVHFHRKQAQGGIHFAFAGGSIYSAQSEGGLLKSTNGGMTWNLVSKSGGGYVLDAHDGLYDIKVHPTDHKILFVSTGYGLYKVVDSGSSATFTKIGIGLPSHPYAVVINHKKPDIMFATAGTKGSTQNNFYF